VETTSDPSIVGDEAVVLARRAACPIVVHRDRVLAARALLSRERVDVLVADDGLQHYRLARDLEIALVDGDYRFGNGLPLPAGPLREPVGRLREVDAVVCNGGEPRGQEVLMRLRGSEAVSLHEPSQRRPLTSFRGSKVHAVAGIGHPQRFFEHLRDFGLTPDEHPFPDHYAFSRRDFAFADGNAILMTEKDAVKCGSWPLANAWYVPVESKLPAGFGAGFVDALAIVSEDR
jgi:tetraacyldisaccharide 4'-kinase